MFGELAQAVERLEISTNLVDLDQVMWSQDRLAAKVTEAVGRVDTAKLWDEVGATSMAAWLTDRAGQTHSTAHRLTRHAKKLARLPVTAEAWADGTLSGGQVDAIVASVKDKYVDRFVEAEAELIPLFADWSVADVAAAMREWRARVDALDDSPPPKEPHREVHLSPILDGRGILSGSLDPDLHELVRTALDAATQPDTETEKANGVDRPVPVRRADALGTICRSFLDHQHAATAASATRHVPHVNVIVDIEDLTSDTPGARYANGAPTSKEWLKTALCDSWVRGIFMTGTTRLLDYGTQTRLCPSDLWHAIVARDQHCRFPGCDRPASWCAAHHVIWHSRGGTTRPDNLTLLCTHHHTVIHRDDWHAKLEPDGTLTVTGPNGNTRTSHPPRQPLPRTGQLQV